jgi:hypothetical protein
MSNPRKNKILFNLWLTEEEVKCFDLRNEDDFRYELEEALWRAYFRGDLKKC